jgi:nicotinate-nucleotide pyrophosphorylase
MQAHNPWMSGYALAEIDRFITLALAEDLGDGDHTSLATIPAEHQSTARLLVKRSGALLPNAYSHE